MNKSEERPLVTLALFAYNQERFIREAVMAALSQEYSKLEIIISDDHSTDSTFKIIESLATDYSGPHKIIINKNKKNLGLARHFSEIVARARGDIIVVAAGDDISLPTRVSKTVEILCSVPEANFVSFTDIVVNEWGDICSNPKSKITINIDKINLEEYVSGRTLKLSGASRGYRKKVFEVFGKLNAECPTEDTPSILRCLMMGNGLVSSDCGIMYRQHGTNLSGPERLREINIEEIKKQYLRDVNLAHSLGIITNAQRDKIANWAEKDFQRRSLSIGFYSSSKRIDYFFREVVFFKDYTLREKLVLLRSGLRLWRQK